jgi:hypothetical protein
MPRKARTEPLTREQIEDQTRRYHERLLRESERPPAPPMPREDRLAERLERADLAFAKHDLRRMRMLLSRARLLLDREDMHGLYAIAAELAHMCKLRTLGLEGAHPIVARAGPPELPSVIESEP